MYKYKLTRERDNKVFHGDLIKYIEWNEDLSFSKSYDEPAVGMSVMLDPHRLNYTWLTTEILSFNVEDNVTYISTKNSKYILETLYEE
jgi:hypothetical protein